jgi:hypothetical protein
MALDFPNSPTNGLVYTSPTGEQWTYDTATNSWTSKGLVNNSGGIKYVGTIDITAAPPTGVTGGALYTVAADGTANAGFGPGVTGALTKGDSVMNTGTGWIKLSHPTSVWLRTGTNLAPTATGDVVSISAGTAALPGLTPVGDPNTGIYSPGADQLAISTGGTSRVYVAADGKVGIGVTAPTTAGGILQLNGGITFPATAVASSDPNTLDDYEEGTWTPAYLPAGNIWSYTKQVGTYVKVGTIVTLFFEITAQLDTVGNLNGQVAIVGPFASGGSVNGSGICTFGTFPAKKMFYTSGSGFSWKAGSGGANDGNGYANTTNWPAGTSVAHTGHIVIKTAS